MFTPQEKVLYHQIHPVKLATDIITAMLALRFLWQHRLMWALIIMWIPSVIVSLLIMQKVNLEPYKESALGRYLKTYMTGRMELLRFIGLGLMALGAWLRAWWLLPFGLC